MVFIYCYGAQGLTEIGAVLERCFISRGINPFLIGTAALILLFTRETKILFRGKKSSMIKVSIISLSPSPLKGQQNFAVRRSLHFPTL